mmetsp:Transcript_17744/g.43779  ORF Transcript_17744/g.43779 Transcript_17744/m.43779 type:complete len:627 (+) Transcript_17744:105-1985(+)
MISCRWTTRLTAPFHLFAWVILLCCQLQTVESNNKAYKLYSSSEIHVMLDEWETKYPNLVRLTTAQEAYGLPTAGSSDDCPFYEGNGCPNAILTIQDYVKHPEGSKSSNALPEVFLSGSVHGNERVGPTAVMETALLLLEAATCESSLHVSSTRSSSSYSYSSTGKQKRTHHSRSTCRTKLAESGIDHVQQRWLARLVSTRRIVIVPTANALGYFQDERTEDGIDPNRDFPYDLPNDPSSSSSCMQTIASRTLNEVFREHLFQMALTIHAGHDPVVAYNWGSPTWYEDDGYVSPDDLAQHQIAAAYSKYGGTWADTIPYEYGPMNDLVYFVEGGMEDWAYAGSWDKERVKPCEPTTFGGYPLEKTVYNNSTLRAFNMLVETSLDKNPPSLGSSEDLLNQDEYSDGNGHVSRNIRLSLLAADLVEPYVSIVQVNDDIILPHDVIPLSSNCDGAKIVAVNASETLWNTLDVAFSVGGALSIDNVELWFASKEDIVSTTANSDCLEQPTFSELQSFTQASILGTTSGTGRFSSNGASPASETGGITDGPVFWGTIEIPNGVSELIVVASARVDQDWKNAPDNAGPDVQPQSHMANVRTNPNWRHESEGKVVQGRLDWVSQPLTVVVVDD